MATAVETEHVDATELLTTADFTSPEFLKASEVIRKELADIITTHGPISPPDVIKEFTMKYNEKRDEFVETGRFLLIEMIEVMALILSAREEKDTDNNN